ncbi:MAG: hypothetical protein CO120_08765 [Gammaproteobacteria bacterium CG_4_9_14_3_um_filter_38_9]|nr:MAG: hypothetical protein CO120_08765 [Gammaproteobacteria bacterium CG_4_9_14_3_um_filter_38_9]
MPSPITQKEYLHRINEKFNNKFVVRLPNKFLLDTEIDVICPDHGSFRSTGSGLLYSKCGCPKCAQQMRAANSQLTQRTPWITRISQFNKIHADKYSYEVNHAGGHRSKIKIQCEIHGLFTKLMSAHLAGQGCPKCQQESTKVFKKSLISEEEKISKSKQNRANANRKRAAENQMPLETAMELVHGKHHNKFTYDWSAYIGWSHKLTITCEKHGAFTQSCKDHVAAARGCPSCARISKSRLEDEWLTSLGVIDRQHKIKLDGKIIKVDGYDSETNTVYEFLGDYWHGHPNWYLKLNGINANNKIPFVVLFKQTKERFDKIKNLGYNVIYVWENDIRTSSVESRTFLNQLEV